MFDNIVNKVVTNVCKTIKFEGDNRTFIMWH